MALRQTTRPHTTEAQLLVLPARVDTTKRSPMQTETAVIDQSLSVPSHSATRRLRNLIILGTAAIWLALIVAIRFLFF